MNTWETALKLLPQRYWDRSSREMISMAEELRLRCGRELTALIGGREYPLEGETIREQDLLCVLEKATAASLHTAAPAMNEGYIQYGGVRIGLCGTPVLQDGRVCGFRRYSSLAIRIPRECRGVCDEIWRQIQERNDRSLLILSPPGGGKTTALRELIRLYSTAGRRIGLVDERFEVAAAAGGEPQYDLGPCCDVLSGLPKETGSMMLLRGMGPQIIAMDEISREEDLRAVRAVAGCGVGILATLHAEGPEDLAKRPLFRSMMDEGLFDAVLVIRCRGGERSYELRRCRE